MTRYSDEALTLAGQFSITAYFLVVDPALVPAVGQVRAASGILLDASAPAGWTAAVEAAVIAKGAEVIEGRSYPDLVSGTVFIPTIA